MIEVLTGNLLRSAASAHVNTVNTVGVMGAGIARQFREAYPAMYRSYQEACRRGDVRIGQMYLFDRGPTLTRPRWIINFPTKQHWRAPSQLAYLEQGLEDLVRHIRALALPSIALPALGCQNGGLAWSVVEPLIQRALAPLVDVQVQLYRPITGGPIQQDHTR